MAILSASRRTDIPGFYADWFMNRIHEGFVLYPLPWSDKLKYLDLTPERVDCIVFWSKNYEKLIPYLNTLDNKGFDYYFHFTINNYPDLFEKSVIPTETAFEQVKKLTEHKSPDHLLWRYDPIIITSDLKSNFHLYNFESIAHNLQGYTKRCYIEFIDMYKKVERNFQKEEVNFIPLSQNQKQTLINGLAKIAQKYDIQVYSCCNESLVNESVLQARCIDPDLIMKLTGKTINYNLAPTRKECGCAKSIDIGEYGTCLHGCLYCYANEKISEAQNFYSNFDVNSPALDKTKMTKFENQNLSRISKTDDGQLKLF